MNSNGKTCDGKNSNFSISIQSHLSCSNVLIDKRIPLPNSNVYMRERGQVMIRRVKEEEFPVGRYSRIAIPGHNLITIGLYFHVCYIFILGCLYVIQ